MQADDADAAPTPADRRRRPDVTESPSGPGARRARPPRGRVSPEALAAARGGAVEGLAWLGRPPEAKASILYRILRLVARFVIFGLLRMRIRTSGQELLPRGGYLLVGAAHRGWMDPFVVMHAIPTEPRAWFLGSAPSTFTSRWRERLIHRLGGLLPVWRGGVGIEQHVASARAVIGNGAVFAQMPEGTVSGPPGRIGPFRAGWAVIALRTDAPDRPAGDRRDRGALRRASDGVAGPAGHLGSCAGRAGAWTPTSRPRGRARNSPWRTRMNVSLSAILGPAVEALYPWTVDPPSHPRRLRKRLTWLLLRPGRLDRDG